jgi:adhesin transport system outer membrane protein
MKYLIKLKGEQLKLVKTLSVFFVLFLNTTIVNASDKFCDTKFDELLFKGLNSHPSIIVSKKLILGADLQLSSAKWGYYPTPTVDIARSSNNTRTTFRLDQPLWAGGKIDAIRDKARSQKNEATYVYAESQFQLIEDYLNTLQKYLQAQDKIDIMQNGVTQLESIMQTIDRMIAAGELSMADKNLLNTRISDIHSSLEITQAEFDVAKIQFEILTGYKIDCNVSFNRSPIFSENINIELLVDEALNFHPSLKILNSKIEVAKSDVDSAESTLWPTLKLRGEHRKGALYDGDSATEENLVYLVLEMSTGAGASALSNIERSKINVLKVKNQKLSKEKEVLDGLMNNYTRFIAVKNNIDILTNDIKIAEKVFKSNKRMFFLQQKKWIEVVNALSALNKKKISKAQLSGEYKSLEMKLALKTNRLSLETGEVLSDVLQ